MKNIEKKWMLFIIATFVTFFGIGYTLLKGTVATEIDNIDDNLSSEKHEADDLTNELDTDLSNIILSDGEIQFDPNVTEYNITVSDFDKLKITPIKKSDKVQYILDKNIVQNNGINTVFITVISENGSSKIYTIYVTEKDTDNINIDNNDKDNTYVPIFIVIIFILVIINIIRIIKNKKK